MTKLKIWDSIRMLVQRCTLDQHRLIIPVSVTKPKFESGSFSGSFTQSRYRGLIDTGAQRTVVARSVIAEHALMRTGHMQFKGIHAPQTHTRYLASIGLWAHRIGNPDPSIPYEQSEQTLFLFEDPVEIVNMDDNSNFDLILGFDVLKNFSFSFDHRTMTFEITVGS